MYKRIVSVLLFTALCSAMWAQISVNRLFNEFSGAENVEKVKLGGLLMSVAKTFERENEELANISGIKVLSLEECSPEVKQRFNERVSKLRDNRYETFLNTNDGSERTKILLRFDKDLIRELVIVTSGDDPALISITGKIDPKDIEKWSSKKRDGEQ